MHIGQILGMETYRDTVNITESILLKTWRENFSTKDMFILTVALIVVSFIILMQLIYFFKYRKKSKHNLMSALLTIIFDILIFVVMVVGQLRLHYFMLGVRAPRSVVFERVSPTLVSVLWKTYDPELSIVLWGYDKEGMSEISLGLHGQKVSREHEVLLNVEPGREVYFLIKTGSRLYGVNRQLDGVPYGVTSLSK